MWCLAWESAGNNTFHCELFPLWTYDFNRKPPNHHWIFIVTPLSFCIQTNNKKKILQGHNHYHHALQSPSKLQIFLIVDRASICDCTVYSTVHLLWLTNETPNQGGFVLAVGQSEPSSTPRGRGGSEQNLQHDLQENRGISAEITLRDDVTHKKSSSNKKITAGTG